MQTVSFRDNSHGMSKSFFETIRMECQSLFSWKNKSNITGLSSADFAKKVVKVNLYSGFFLQCNYDALLIFKSIYQL